MCQYRFEPLRPCVLLRTPFLLDLVLEQNYNMSV